LDRLVAENQRLNTTIAELERGQRRLQTDLAATQEMLSKERHDWNAERARYHSMQALPSDVQTLQQEVRELQAIIANQVAEKRDSDRERQQLEQAIADLRMQNLQQQGYSLKVDPALYNKVEAPSLAPVAPDGPSTSSVFFAPVSTDLYPQMMMDCSTALTPLMEMEAAMGAAAGLPPPPPPPAPSPLTLALGPFEPLPVAARAPPPAPSSAADQVRAKLRGMTEKDIERKFNVAELTDMLGVFGKLYEKPKPLAARSLYAAVTSH
jgi:hypothetical protein